MRKRAQFMYLGTVVATGLGLGALVESLWGLGVGALVVAVGLAFPLVAVGETKPVEKGPKGKIV